MELGQEAKVIVGSSLPICEIRTSGKKIFHVLLVKGEAKTVIILHLFFF
jgi:hypothetical protein